MIDSGIHWLTDWLIDFFFEPLIDWLIEFHRLIDWISSIDWLITQLCIHGIARVFWVDSKDIEFVMFWRRTNIRYHFQCVKIKGESLVEEANQVYSWIPHDGRPVHSVQFLDDFTPTSVQEQFWLFAITGSEFGRQFRIWNCQNWSCLQTIDILPSPDRPLELPKLQVAVDPRGDYLILGDTLRNLLMFLRVDKEGKRLAMVTCVDEFLVGSPILNLVAVHLKAIRPDRDSLLPLDRKWKLCRFINENSENYYCGGKCFFFSGN